MATDMRESDAAFGDEAPRKSFGGAEQLRDLGDGQVPLDLAYRAWLSSRCPLQLPKARKAGLRLGVWLQQRRCSRWSGL